jgi:ribonuclease-3
MRNPYRQLERRLGYKFKRRERLTQALTHRSFRYESEGIDDDNQRLEYLGDAALGFLTAAYLYDEYPEMQEGELTKLRSRVTSGKPLAEIAGRVYLGEFLQLGRGEAQSGGHERLSNLTDGMEAVMGAAYCDGGIKAVQKIFNKLIVPYIEDLHPAHANDNPKGHLQEIAQGRWRVTPRYRVISEEGPPHDRVYTVEVRLNDHLYGTGSGGNKRIAQTEAARLALRTVEFLGELPPPKDAALT